MAGAGQFLRMLIGHERSFDINAQITDNQYLSSTVGVK